MYASGAGSQETPGGCELSPITNAVLDEASVVAPGGTGHPGFGPAGWGCQSTETACTFPTAVGVGMAPPGGDDHQPVVGSDKRDQATVRRERGGGATHEASYAAIAHAQDHDPPARRGRDLASVGRPRRLRAGPDQPQLTRTTRPNHTAAYDREQTPAGPDRVGRGTRRRLLLADPIDPVERHPAVLDKRDHRTARHKRRVRRRAERAVHARAIRIHDPDSGAGEHERAAVRRPPRPARNSTHPSDGANPVRAAAVRRYQDNPPARPRLHRQHTIRPGKRRHRSRREHPNHTRSDKHQRPNNTADHDPAGYRSVSPMIGQ